LQTWAPGGSSTAPDPCPARSLCPGNPSLPRQLKTQGPRSPTKSWAPPLKTLQGLSWEDQSHQGGAGVNLWAFRSSGGRPAHRPPTARATCTHCRAERSPPELQDAAARWRHVDRAWGRPLSPVESAGIENATYEKADKKK